MKILFLQNIGNVLGGVSYVNKFLGEEFSKDNNEVYILSVRKGGDYEFPNSSVSFKTINKNKTWGAPLYSEIINEIKTKNIKKALNKLCDRIKYNKTLKRDYKILKKEILKINPDIIINSHYELLNAIPKEYLNKTINHYHTNFGQVLGHRDQIKVFNKYKTKIKKFVWLTKTSCMEAKKFGIENSIHIYNPLNVTKKIDKNVNINNKFVFLARYSKEKRVDLAVNIFNSVTENNDFKDWSLDLYLVGELDDEFKILLSKSKNVNYKGAINNPQSVLSQYYGMMITSEYEGFPLTVIESAECGVPVIAFDFGESVNEAITSKTGIVVPQNDVQLYKEKLIAFMKNKEKRDVMSKECIEFAKKFYINNIKEDWYSVF